MLDEDRGGVGSQHIRYMHDEPLRVTLLASSTGLGSGYFKHHRSTTFFSGVADVVDMGRIGDLKESL